jgi:hypothetical protein
MTAAVLLVLGTIGVGAVLGQPTLTKPSSRAGPEQAAEAALVRLDGNGGASPPGAISRLGTVVTPIDVRAGHGLAGDPRVCQDREVKAEAAKTPKWTVSSTRYYQLHHDPARAADAKKARDILNRAIESLQKAFRGHAPEKLLREADCQIYLHPKSNDQASDGLASLRTEVSGGKYLARIDWLTPSAFRADFRNSIGEPAGEDYFAKVLVHEYGTILLERITRAKPRGWRFYDAPPWFVQGYEEYLGLTHSTPHNRTVVLPKCIALQRDPDRVRIGFGIGVKDDYVDGAVLLHFMHETFGAAKVQAILTSEATTFEKAAGPALGVTLDEFGRRWEEWRSRRH